jgi:hypothetical protein
MTAKITLFHVLIHVFPVILNTNSLLGTWSDEFINVELRKPVDAAPYDANTESFYIKL